MDESYFTYVGDEHNDNHAYDDNTTNDDHDNDNDIYGHNDSMSFKVVVNS